MGTSDLFIIGCVTAIGFTVSLFVAGVAFQPGVIQDGAKMGVLLSVAAAAMSFIAARVIGVEKRELR